MDVVKGYLQCVYGEGKVKKNRILHNIFNPDIFKGLFFLVSILMISPLGINIVTPYLKVFHIYAFCVLGFDFFGEKRIFKNKGRLWLFIFGCFYCITLLNNTNLINVSGISDICYFMETLVIVYSYGENSKRNNQIIGNVISILITIANTIGIYMFFAKIHIYYLELGFIGMYPHENRLCGLFGNPNVLGIISLIGLSLSLVLYFDSMMKRKWMYLGCAGINFIALLLSNSRTQIYSLVLLGIVFCFLQTIKGNKGVKKTIFSIVVAMGTGVLIFGGCKVIQYGISLADVRYNYYLENIDEEYSNKGVESETKQEEVKPEEELKDTISIGRNDSGLNGRWELWMTGIKMIAHRPIFGYGLNNQDYALSQLGDDYLEVGGGLHNAYIDGLVAVGFAGFSCFIAFFVGMLIDGVKFFKYKNDVNWEKGTMLVAVVAAFMLDGVADSTLMGSLYPTAIMLWYVFSEFAFLLEENKKKVDSEKSTFKVLHCLAKMDRGGQETFIMNLFRKIDRERIKFDFLCSEYGVADYEEEINNLGGRIFHTKELTINNCLKYFQRIKYMCEFLKNKEASYDVVHIHTHHAMDALIYVISAKLSGVRIVVVHSHNTMALYHLVAHKICKQALKLFDIKRFACSEVAGEWMFDKKEFTVIHNGIDIESFKYNVNLRKEVREKLNWNEKKIVGHVGRFNEQKNHKFLIEIFEALHKADPDTFLVLVGKGELEVYIRQQVKEKGLENDVCFLGTREDVNELYQGMDLFLFPSLFEGLPVVLVEVQASGLPCLISNTISSESIFGKSVIKKSLDESCEMWAKKATELLDSQNVRIDTSDEVRIAGYDMGELANKLELLYNA